MCIFFIVNFRMLIIVFYFDQFVMKVFMVEIVLKFVFLIVRYVDVWMDCVFVRQDGWV